MEKEDKKPKFHFVWVLICLPGLIASNYSSVKNIAISIIDSIIVCSIIIGILYLIYKSKLKKWEENHNTCVSNKTTTTIDGNNELKDNQKLNSVNENNEASRKIVQAGDKKSLD